MKILVIGAGNIGTAVSFFLTNNFLEKVTLLDSEDRALKNFIAKFPTRNCAMELINQDVFSKEFFNKLTIEYDILISTLSWREHIKLCNILEGFSITIIGIARPDYVYYRQMQTCKKSIKATIIHGCGLEPGLSELFTQHLINRFTKLNEVFIACGGIPAKPVPPLDYRLVFGGNNLPFQQRETLKIHGGALCAVSRFGEVEDLPIQSVGMLECWNDGLTPWFSEYLIQKGVTSCAQKTIRWPGYAKIVKFLSEAGFLSEEAIIVDNEKIIPLTFTKKVLLPKLELAADEIDMVIQYIRIRGLFNGKLQECHFKFFDYKDLDTGLSAMARSTGFTTALVARFLRDEKQTIPGEFMMTEFYSDGLCDYLIEQLKNAGMNITVNFSSETAHVN